MSSEFSNPHERSFGVEIECGFPGGYEAACELFNVDYDQWYDDPDEALKNWSVGEDGTEVEIRTPVLYGEAGFKTLRSAMDRIRDAGGYVTPQDGMHVHHGASEFVDNPPLCSLLVKSWKNNEEAIHSMVAPRRRALGACPKWSEAALSVLERWLQGMTPGTTPGFPAEFHFFRNDLNLIPLPRYGTVEVRLHEGTLDPDVAISWVKFFQVFMHEVLEGAEELAPAPTDSDLLSRIKLAPEAQAALEAKRSSSYLTPNTSFRPRAAYREDW